MSQDIEVTTLLFPKRSPNAMKHLNVTFEEELPMKVYAYDSLHVFGVAVGVAVAVAVGVCVGSVVGVCDGVTVMVDVGVCVGVAVVPASHVDVAVGVIVGVAVDMYTRHRMFRHPSTVASPDRYAS